jgi:hypothetical protein
MPTQTGRRFKWNPTRVHPQTDLYQDHGEGPFAELEGNASESGYYVKTKKGFCIIPAIYLVAIVN